MDVLLFFFLGDDFVRHKTIEAFGKRLLQEVASFRKKNRIHNGITLLDDVVCGSVRHEEPRRGFFLFISDERIKISSGLFENAKIILYILLRAESIVGEQHRKSGNHAGRGRQRIGVISKIRTF